jgi:saccharopine dehydrogenase-like NADP-dependent oxidoreductase
MGQRVLVLGGRGRIGRAIVDDLLRHTKAMVIATGRRPSLSSPQPQRLVDHCLDLDQSVALDDAIASVDLVIHCAGPFHHRDGRVLHGCIRHRVNYIDISDHRGFTEMALKHHAAAQAAGITAVVNAGIFPGISNSMVRQGIETLDQAEAAHLSYVVGGSGGAGITVLRTTFLGLQQPIVARLQGQWQQVQPYSDRQVVRFPEPFGQVGVYWFDVPETGTLVDSFGLRTVTTKFGSVPDLYNHLTWLVARSPRAWLQQPAVVEGLAQVSYRMTQWSDRWSGVGVGIHLELRGQRQGQPTVYQAQFVHPQTAIAAAAGVGSVAQPLLTGRLHQPGVYPVERILPTDDVRSALAQRGMEIQQTVGST